MDVFVDLDGVIADFDEGYPRMFSKDHTKIPNAEMWADINAHPTFFRDLKPIPGGLDWFKTVRQITNQALGKDPIILTACSRSRYARTVDEKQRWIIWHINRHLPEPIEIRTVTSGHLKSTKMNAVGDILIDDWSKNIIAWDQADGVGIKHERDDPLQSILVLTAHLYKAVGKPLLMAANYP